MKKIIYATMCIFSLCLGSCEYDDAEVWDAINSQEERIAALEEWRETVNENIAALQAIVNGNDYITSVEELKEGDEIIGYTINFHRQGEVTIYNGKDGEKGDTPVISVTEGEDGRWYWTLNGELMEDADGNPVCASGKDGEDGEDGQDGAPGSSSSGVTPMIKLGSDLGDEYNQYASYLSVDGGKTWTQINVPVDFGGNTLEAIYDYGSYFYFQFSHGEGYTSGMRIAKYGTGLSFYYHSEAEPGVGTGISNGKLSVVAGETFRIAVWKSEGGDWSYNETEVNSDNSWEFEREKGEYDVDYLVCEAPAEGEPVTLKFTYINENNEVKYYQVEITIKEDVVIEKETNSALIDALRQNQQNIGTIDGEGNLVITQEKIESITYLNVSSGNLATLDGLEVFTSLAGLNCSNNQLPSIDLTKYPQLTSLDCSNNQLTSIDLESSPQLTYLDCSKNPLTLLDVSGLTELIELHCDDCFNSTSTRSGNIENGVLDLSTNTKLQYLSCANNALTELKLPETETLRTIYCSNNRLTDLVVSNNVNLERLSCESNELQSINVSLNTKLVYLALDYNKIEELNVSQNALLQTLWIPGNLLTELDLSHNTALTQLYCGQNQLTALNVSNNTALIDLGCGSQQDSNGGERELFLMINEAQKELWETQWQYQNYNVTVSDKVVSVSGGNGSNFENGGVY